MAKLRHGDSDQTLRELVRDLDARGLFTTEARIELYPQVTVPWDVADPVEEFADEVRDMGFEVRIVEAFALIEV